VRFDGETEDTVLSDKEMLEYELEVETNG